MIFAVAYSTIISEIVRKPLMRKNYYLAFNNYERRFLVKSLNQLRNGLIAGGKYTDAVYEVLLKIFGTKQKKFKV